MGDVWAGLKGGRGLRDWLLSSAYDDDSQSQERRQRRKKRSRKGKGSEQGFRGDRIAVAASAANHIAARLHEDHPELAHIGRRHLRRWMNDRLLQELAGPLDYHAIGGLFAPPPFGEAHTTPLGHLVEREQAGGSRSGLDVTWEPFRSVDMDRQDALLRKALEMRPHRHASSSSHQISSAREALARWRAMDKRVREAVKRRACWPRIAQLEDEVVAFILGHRMTGLSNVSKEEGAAGSHEARRVKVGGGSWTSDGQPVGSLNGDGDEGWRMTDSKRLDVRQDSGIMVEGNEKDNGVGGSEEYKGVGGKEKYKIAEGNGIDGVEQATNTGAKCGTDCVGASEELDDGVPVMGQYDESERENSKGECREEVEARKDGKQECVENKTSASGDVCGVKECGGVLQLAVEDAYHRLLLHALCQFHSLISRTSRTSFGVPVVNIHRRNKASLVLDDSQGLRLSSFLRLHFGWGPTPIPVAA